MASQAIRRCHVELSLLAFSLDDADAPTPRRDATTAPSSSSSYSTHS